MRHLRLDYSLLLVVLVADVVTDHSVAAFSADSARPITARCFGVLPSRTGFCLHASNDDNMEKAWRYIRKPLLKIGGKGATSSHGNSLRQLVEQHTMVKVKINTRMFDNSLTAAFEELVRLAEERGAPPGLELLQARDYDKIILLGAPGTRQRIFDGDFPPTVDLDLSDDEDEGEDE